MSKFVRDEGHCKFPSYTKDEVNNLLLDKVGKSDVYVKENYAVLNYTIPAESMFPDANYTDLCEESGVISLPSGFAAHNTLVISKMFKIGDTVDETGWVFKPYGRWLDTSEYAYYDSGDTSVVSGGKLIIPLGINDVYVDSNSLHFTFREYGTLEDPLNEGFYINKEPIYIRIVVMRVN